MILLAIYDMDKTLTRHATWTRFLVHAARRLAPWRLALLPVAALASLAYVARLIDRAMLKQLSHRLLLGAHLSPSELAPVVDAFAQATLARNLRSGAQARLAADRAAGYRLVLATASYRLYAAAIAEQLGMDAVVATNSVIGLDSRVQSRIDGENCYGPAKLRMVTAWLAQQGIARGDAHIRFYSDHVSDSCVLEWADEGFAVNAHAPLRQAARQRGWTALDLDRG